MDTRTYRRILRIAIDIVCLVLICIPHIVFKYGDIKPYIRGFYCNDETINKPYKSSTVHWADSIIVSVLLVALFVAFIELLKYYLSPNKELLNSFTIGKVAFNDFFVNTYKYVGIYFFGLAFCMSFTYIGKFTIGRLRPHFLTVCMKDQVSWEKVNCTGPLPGMWKYIDDPAACTGDPKKVLEARQSFPSGHSSLMFYAMVYLAVYIQERMTWKFSRLLRHLLQAGVLWNAFYTSLTRVSDYKHHPTDVLAGAVLGLLGVIFTIHWVPEMFGLPVRRAPDYDGSTNACRKFSGVTPSMHMKKTSRTSGRSSFSNQINDAAPIGPDHPVNEII